MMKSKRIVDIRSSVAYEFYVRGIDNVNHTLARPLRHINKKDIYHISVQHTYIFVFILVCQPII